MRRTAIVRPVTRTELKKALQVVLIAIVAAASIHLVTGFRISLLFFASQGLIAIIIYLVVRRAHPWINRWTFPLFCLGAWLISVTLGTILNRIVLGPELIDLGVLLRPANYWNALRFMPQYLLLSAVVVTVAYVVCRPLPAKPPDPDRDAKLGRSQRRTGLTLLFTGVAAALVIKFVEIGDVRWLVIANLPLAAILGGAFLLYRGKQHSARARATVHLRDPRPPVVYLRSFKEDTSWKRAVFPALTMAGLFQILSSVEEQLAEALEPVGPVVTVGEPGEALPKPGATRVYAESVDWRIYVNDLLLRARLVVLRLGDSDSLWWEFARVRETCEPERFLILLLRLRKRRYEAFAAKARTLLGLALPPYREIKRRGGVTGFLAFDSHWRPRLLRLKAPYFRAGGHKGLRSLFHYALQPVFRNLGVAWSPCSVSAFAVVSSIILGLVALLVLIVVASVALA